MIDWLKRTAIEPEIELNGETVPVVIRRHHNAKRLTLRLAPDGSEVRITLPRWANANEAIAFAHARTEWLGDQLRKVPQRSSPKPGGDLMIRGEQITLTWDEKWSRRPRLADGELQVGGPAEGLEARIRRWLEREALAQYEQDTAHYCERAGLESVPVALSRAQKRWGSCSDQRRIRINWRLIQAPDFVRRSVVAHEVTHLVHFDHSPAFHALLADIFEDDINEADHWLKSNGRSLYTSFG